MSRKTQAIWRKQLNAEFNLIPFYVAILAICAIALSSFVIQDFSGSLTGSGDEEQWEYAGFYVFKNLRFTPFPQLDLVNNQVFYPYGTNSIFQPWSLERDFFYGAFSSLFGIRGWLQSYYLATVLATALGTFAFLLRDYGIIRAGGASLLVSFFNFYAIHKYPAHLSYAVLHWTVLSLVADFLMVKRVAFKQKLSLRFILLRVLLLILSISQELGYIAGFALMSFTVSILYVFVILLYQQLRSKANLKKIIQTLTQEYKSEFLTHLKTCLLLVSCCLIAAYFYIPLVFQIVREAKGFNFLSVRDFYWTNLYRLFIPYFPDLNPGLSFEKILGDEPEGFGAGSPGWFLLIIGTIGLWQSRKKILIFAPLITIFLLCLFYFPATFPTLKIFPWFAFNRVPGRVTVLYPVILTLFSLELNFNYIDHWKRKFAVASLVGLACVEIHTAYSLKLNEYQPYLFDTNFFSYMNIVKNQPGEAVLDWPFCIAGGNGKGVSDGMCPYYQLINSTHALRRFHRKKVVGQYFGRLHFSQIQPQLKAGWQNLFFSNGSESFSATQQARCFNDDEWSFFTDFYLKNDFAGINLYTSLLPETCVEEFHTRFGSPIAQTTIPSGVRLEFIAKPPKLRTEVNLDLGKKLRFRLPPSLQGFSYEIKIFEPPISLRAGEKASNLPIVVKNTGDIAWLATGNNPTQISYRWIVKDKGVETFSGENAVFLAENVAPQGAIALNLSIRAPMQAGNYTLQLRIVQGKQGRSESKIVKPIAIPVKIIS